MAGGPLNSVLRHLRRLVGGPPVVELSDRQLLERFHRERDESAFAALVERHGGMVLGVCRRIVQNREDAEDAYQGTFLVLARKAGALRWQDSIASWLHAVACRVARKIRCRTIRDSVRASQLPAPGTAPDPIGDLTCRELELLLDEEVQRLPQRYRAPLVLCYLEGKTRDEAAELLGWSVGALKGCLERGRELLRRRLVKRGVALPTALVGAWLLQGTAEAAVPVVLRHSAIGAGLAFAAGQPLAGLVGTSAQAAAQGVLRALLLSRVLTVTGVLLAVVLSATGVGLAVSHRLPASGPNVVPPSPAALVEVRTAETVPERPPQLEPAEQPEAPPGAAAEKLFLGDPAPRRVRVSGTLASVDLRGARITLNLREGERARQETFSFSADVPVILDGQPAGSLRELAVRAAVRLEVSEDRTRVFRIQVDGPMHRAVVRWVDPGRQRLALGEEPTERVLVVVPGAPILMDEKAAGLGDIPAGAFAAVQVSADGKRALSVRASKARERRPERERPPQARSWLW
jgi:RNA polymerase sigma factor (sigma-70 family)